MVTIHYRTHNCLYCAVPCKSPYSVKILVDLVWKKSLLESDLCNFVCNKAKGRISKQVLKKTKLAKFSKKQRFLTS